MFLLYYRIVHRLALLLLGGGLALACAAQPLAVGKGQFEYRDAGNPDKPITVWYYRPASLRPDSKVVFVMHGTLRNGETYRDHWAAYAQRHHFLLIVPEFAKAYYREADYQFGGVRHADPARWSFASIEHLFDLIRNRESLQTAQYYLYGHSAGAQFVHRLMLFMPHPRVALAIAANAGAYTLPRFPAGSQPGFPWALDPARVDEGQLTAALAQPLLVLLGEEDTDPHHPHLPKEAEAEAQGPNRLQRGQYFFQLARQQAQQRAVPFHWRLRTVPGVGHSDSGMARAAVEEIISTP